VPPSIAVLAFDDLSPNKDQDYFCEGIAEEIINDLARIEGVRVAARTSAFAYRGTTLDIREIGRKLGVATVLEGSVRKAGDRLRITAQLVSVTDGYHLWSERFDRQLRDVFAIQEEIARSIVRALRLSLTRGEGWESAKPATRDIEAYDFYLRGRQFFYRAKRQALEFALRMFGQATERDPGYALAYAGMADSYSYLCMYHGGQDADLEWADRASRKALELAPNLAEAHAARGLAVSLRGRYDEAEREFEEAMRIDPDLFEAYYFYGRTCVAQGKLEDAARLFEKAGDVRPEDYQALSLLGFTFVGLDRPRQAELAYVRAFKRTERYLQLNPDDSRATYLGGQSLIRLGEDGRGLEWVDRAIALDPEDPYIIYGAACAYCLVHRLDEAVQLLERAVRAGFAHVKWIEHDHDFDAIRDDPRFDAILQEARELHRSENRPVS
jgi:TolB-like protein/Flp pilus assembly protein TadD